MNLAQRFLMGVVRGYRLTLSPWIGGACRFEPTCSVYSLQALERHGALAGAYLTAARIARCNPWCAGGHDDVPDEKPKLWQRRAAPSCHAPPRGADEAKRRPGGLFSRWTSAPYQEKKTR